MVILDRCSTGGPRAHFREQGGVRTLCGRKVITGSSPELWEAKVCWQCEAERKKHGRALPLKQPVFFPVYARGKFVHLASDSHLWKGPGSKTLCGRTVTAVIAGPMACSCEACANKAKTAAA